MTPRSPGALALRALGLWLILMAAESAHGVLRRLLIDPVIGEAAARRLGVLIGSALICALVWIFRAWLSPARVLARIVIGLAWAGLTIAFELALGSALGESPSRVLADYDLTRGGLMPFGLLLLVLAPVVLGRPRSGHAAARR